MSTFVIQLSARCAYFNRLTDALAMSHPGRYLNIVSNLQRYRDGQQGYHATFIIIAFNLMSFPDLHHGMSDMLRHIQSELLLKTIRLNAMKVNLKKALGEENASKFKKIERDINAYQRGEVDGERTACEIASVVYGIPEAMKAVSDSNVIF